MGMMRIAGLCALVPISLLLTVSFFVLLSLRKAEAKEIKIFGYVVAALLWLAALAVSSAGLYTLATGRCPMMNMMRGGMCGEMMEKKMMGGSMHGMMEGKKQMMQDKMCGKMQEGMPKK